MTKGFSKFYRISNVLDRTAKALQRRYPQASIHREKFGFTFGNCDEVVEFQLMYNEDYEGFYIPNMEIGLPGQGIGMEVMEIVTSALFYNQFHKLYIVDNVNPEWWNHVADKLGIEIENVD